MLVARGSSIDETKYNWHFKRYNCGVLGDEGILDPNERFTQDHIIDSVLSDLKKDAPKLGRR
jgi:predicted transcriptional regulator